jgi:hypothetical protein
VKPPGSAVPSSEIDATRVRDIRAGVPLALLLVYGNCRKISADVSSPRHSRAKQLIPVSIQLASLAALTDVWYFRLGAEEMVSLGMNFCTNFVPPTRQSGLFSPSGRTQNQQLACYQYPLGVRFRPWPPFSITCRPSLFLGHIMVTKLLDRFAC